MLVALLERCDTATVRVDTQVGDHAADAGRTGGRAPPSALGVEFTLSGQTCPVGLGESFGDGPRKSTHVGVLARDERHWPVEVDVRRGADVDGTTSPGRSILDLRLARRLRLDALLQGQ